MIKIIRICLLIIIISSCSGGDTNTIDIIKPIGTPIIQHVEEEFIPHVNSFLNEMESRGLNLKNKKLAVVFVNKLSARNSEGFCGYGYSNFQGSGRARVEIIDSENCWYRWNDTQQENFIYHELGHALLAKGHSNAFYPNGSPKSLMCSSDVCNNYRIYNKYQPEQRNYYLDQLRDSQIQMPEWARKKIFRESLFSDNFDNATQNWETGLQNGQTDSNPYTFSITNQNVLSEPDGLIIQSEEHSDTGVFATWYKDFFINDFEFCSNIIVRSDIITRNLTDGTVGVIVDLYDNSDQIFMRHYKYLSEHTTAIQSYDNVEVNVTCMPKETNYIRVRFYLRTQEAATVSLDNLNIELYE